MIYNDGYYHSLDRYPTEPAHVLKDLGMEPPKIKVDSNTISTETVGDSLWFHGQDAKPIPSLQARIRQGAGHIEVTAPGQGRGDQNNPTFEMIDSEQRKEMKELAELSEVDVSTHATPSVWGVAGFDNREGFSKQQRWASVNEIKKAIDFAADATNGGSVVVHTGEFPRGLSSQDWNKKGTAEFNLYPEEHIDEMHYLVDNRTGKIIKSVRENEVIFRGVQKEDENGSPVWMTDENGTVLYDDIIKDQIMERHTEKYGNGVTWQDIPEELKKQAMIPVWELDKEKNIITKKTDFKQYREEKLAEGKTENEIAKEFFSEQQAAQIQHQLGQAREFELMYIDGLEELDKIKKALKFYKELKAKVPEEEWYKFKQLKEGGKYTRYFIPNEVNDPVEYLQEKLNEINRRVAYGRETSLSGRKQAKELLRMVDHVDSVKDYGIKESRKSYADLGIYALERSRMTKKPIFISMENIYPETYGAHPQELRTLVTQARKEMTDRLVKHMQYSEEDAKEAAKKHIKVTLDTGHLNTWRKYFKPEQGENKEATDARFKKWFLKEVDTLAKEKMIGNVHLADNMGYDDAHLAPGFGNTPIKEFMEILDKHGFDGKMAVEGGFPQGRIGFHEAWRFFDSPVYSVVPSFQRGGWGSVHHMQHGYGAPPNYIVGAYAPSNEWKLWSEVPLE